MLTEQAKCDRRTVPLVWLWRLLRDEDENGTAPDEVLSEAPRVTKRYAAPIGVHLFVNREGEQKRAERAGVQTKGIAKIGWTRAEARALGVVLGTFDVPEGLVGDASRTDPIYVPRAQDMFRHADRIYEVKQLSPEYLGPTAIPTRWLGTAHAAADDFTAVGFPGLATPPTHEPPPRGAEVLR